jgi:predicted metalloprotease
MRWQDREESSNVEDRRSATPGRVVAGGGIGTVVILVVMYFMGADPQQLLNVALNSSMPDSSSESGAPPSPEQDELARFVSVVLADTEKVWNEQFQLMGKTYREPHLILFTGRVRSACGMASSASGPFYCPGDEQVYVDLDFYRELKERFKAPGDFAQAYVIAHEIGHHVQNQVGGLDHEGGSVETELQADCLAGVWAHSAGKRNLLEPGDMEEALDAAAAVGDDNIQKKTSGTVRPETWTHGSSAQRQAAFRRGADGGTMSACGL